jgi:hypothetical protein
MRRRRREKWWKSNRIETLEEKSRMDIGKVGELKEFIDACKSNPSLLHTPSLSFFKSYLLRYDICFHSFSLTLFYS